MTQRKGTAKLNDLLDIELQVQERWYNDKVFESDAPEGDFDDSKYVMHVMFCPISKNISASNYLLTKLLKLLFCNCTKLVL